MLIDIPYDRERAIEYARRWALSRNPLFIDFTGRGGDCTSFVSQCVFAGCGIMNYTPTFGWYYISSADRAPAWAGVDEFFDFVTAAPAFVEANGGTGPRGFDVRDGRDIALGDVIQLANDRGEFYHSLIISGFTDDDILICAHTDDALDRPISTYNYAFLRVIHIEKAIIEVNSDALFRNLLDGTALPMRSMSSM
ncbi:MAG: amidase domain-containing protein [Clostridia bacterium]|nr:amidase domain-containing protein [Clostridia bacterium]